MTVESAADLAGMFDPGEFGAAGTYTPPGGDPVAVDVLLWRPDEVDWQPLSSQLASLVSPGVRLSPAELAGARLAELRADQVAQPVKGAVLVADGRTWAVREVLSLDGSGRVWRLALGRGAAA